jgi:hypothetical protein
MEMASFCLKIRHVFGFTWLTERSIGAGPPVIIQLSGAASLRSAAINSYLIITVILLILKCLASKHCCVTVVVGSNNMWKAKIAKVNRLKLYLVRIFEIFYHQIW